MLNLRGVRLILFVRDADSSLDDDYLNIFLEYVPGGSVTALLRNYGAFEEPLVKNFVRQILQGLNYLHERDIIHRDIKGANILVDNKGGIKISDFGISKKVGDSKCSCFIRHNQFSTIFDRYTWQTGEQTFFARVRFLDGSRGCEADLAYSQSRYMERGLFGG